MVAPNEADELASPPEPAPVDAPGSRAELIGRLFREHNEALVRFLAARLHSRQAASEVAQEAYVRLLSLDKPGAASYFRSLLFRTAANLATDRRRREHRYSHIIESPLFREFTDGRTPERHTVGAQTVQRLERLVAALPPKCRQAFWLNRVEGLDFPEIAQRMNLSERMVRTHVVAALLHCRSHLDMEIES